MGAGHVSPRTGDDDRPWRRLGGSSAEAGLVRRYFQEVLDRGKVELIDELFHPRCVMHRPGGPVAGLDGVRGVAARRQETFSRFETVIHDLFGAGDRLVVRLTHRGVGCGSWRSRLGQFDLKGKTVSWEAMAIFRFEEDKIVEEWVTRDEVAIALQLGIVKPSSF